jgi:hypothetical protein
MTEKLTPERAAIYAAMAAEEEMGPAFDMPDDSTYVLPDGTEVPTLDYMNRFQSIVRKSLEPNEGVEKSSKKIATLPSGTLVPTLLYIQSLESVIRQQQKTIDFHKRELGRIYALLSQQRAVTNKNTTRIAEVERDMDNKIDRRNDY